MAIVRAVRDQGRSPSRVARQFNISRQRVHQILNAYDTGGAAAVAPKSRAPHTHPHAVPEALRKEIIDIRKQLTRHGLDAGPETIAYHLEQDGKHAPSTSTIRRILTNEGLITPEPKKKPKSAYIRFEAALPNECWQADITNIFLANGTRVEVLDFLDDHSRFLLSITADEAFPGPAVAEELSRLISQYGPPASTLTDNGLVFTARLAGRKGGRNAFEKVLTAYKIQQKTGAQDIPKPKAKSNDSTKHSKNGSAPDHQHPPSGNSKHSSTSSAPTTTPNAPTAHWADAHQHRPTPHAPKPPPTTTHKKNGAPDTTPYAQMAKSPCDTPANSSTSASDAPTKAKKYSWSSPTTTSSHHWPKPGKSSPSTTSTPAATTKRPTGNTATHHYTPTNTKPAPQNTKHRDTGLSTMSRLTCQASRDS